ncbi:MAG: SDR family NAD(P)-dependent oxidoreductase [Hyphomicrobiales bacterium]|nr:SDR family NAD(P)-dependent oxidoreductase [Hyphomicrobiales bacterium]
MPASSLENRRSKCHQRVLITAGASGIGRRTADAFARNGAHVWVADIDKSVLETCGPTGAAIRSTSRTGGRDRSHGAAP